MSLIITIHIITYITLAYILFNLDKVITYL